MYVSTYSWVTYVNLKVRVESRLAPALYSDPLPAPRAQRDDASHATTNTKIAAILSRVRAATVHCPVCIRSRTDNQAKIAATTLKTAAAMMSPVTPYSIATAVGATPGRRGQTASCRAESSTGIVLLHCVGAGSRFSESQGNASNRAAHP